jgi:hypothetical protein
MCVYCFNFRYGINVCGDPNYPDTLSTPVVVDLAHTSHVIKVDCLRGNCTGRAAGGWLCGVLPASDWSTWLSWLHVYACLPV